jgi:2-iminobutanoate/2-iminopropanoate deaminase
MIAGALLLPAVTFAADAAIERLAKVPPGPVLDAVVLPPNAEIMIISGQTPAPLDPAKIDGIDDFGDMKAQARSVFEKIKAILERRGYRCRTSSNSACSSSPILGKAASPTLRA